MNVTELQRRLYPVPANPKTGHEYRKVARWCELEATRNYTSAPDSIRYAQNLRWAEELTGLFGPGTWKELTERSGHRNPEDKT